ncbi:unnamed protein product [Mesocestoides corti]|uniref:MFS_1_like domain-containing protein n=1 Tax=Mesocestoides corti TaxID=53468 RepID=A0A0R3U2A0_MESCO|nr:unnamed protein product [Mesocestoides corti]
METGYIVPSGTFATTIDRFAIGGLASTVCLHVGWHPDAVWALPQPCPTHPSRQRRLTFGQSTFVTTLAGVLLELLSMCSGGFRRRLLIGVCCLRTHDLAVQRRCQSASLDDDDDGDISATSSLWWLVYLRDETCHVRWSLLFTIHTFLDAQISLSALFKAPS